MASLPPPTQLSPSVFLHNPPQENRQDTNPGPRLVILASWAFAHDNHIAKYVCKYRELFPNATILVCKCFLRHFFWIPAAQEELVPAVSVIRSVLGTDGTESSEDPENSSQPSLLMHVFSNSGLATMYNLCDTYAAHSSDKDIRLPLHATIFDSTPGRYEYRSVASAVMFGAPRGLSLQRLISLPLAHLLSSSLWVYVRVLRGQDWVACWADAANDGARVRETCRSYAYSRADPLVESRAVEANAEDASARGFSVLHRADFLDSAHVSHARVDPVRYWGIVRETWEGC